MSSHVLKQQNARLAEDCQHIRILHECSCLIEFTKQVWRKR